MSDQQIIEEERIIVLKDIFRNAQVNRAKNEVIVFCPKHYHHKRKLQINIRKNFFHCWVCGFSGKNIFKLLKEVANKQQKEKYYLTLGIIYKENIPEKTISLPNEYRFILDNLSTPTGSRALQYLLNELKINKNFLLQNKIGYCDSGRYANRIIFPSFDSKGLLNYFTSRSLFDNFYKKYLDCEDVKKSTIIYNELYVDWEKPVIIVESIKTHLKHFCVPNVIPILGSSFGENFELFKEIILNDCKTVYVGLDPDAKQKALSIVNKLNSHAIETKLVDFKKQPDDLTTEEFVERLKNATVSNKYDVLKERIASL